MPTMRAAMIATVIIGLSAAHAPDLLAQGKSSGLGRGLAAAAKGSSASGLAKAASRSANATDRILRSGSTMGRAAGGLQRADATLDNPATPTDGATPSGQALNNPQRILDQRIQQSDHLRTVSESNGNQHLLDTADRMQANATANFERQQQHFNQLSTTSSTQSGTSSAPPAITGNSSSAPQADGSQARPRRGLWIRSR